MVFLPAALEIVEAPPSPIGRAIGLTLIALFCLALAWAAFGHIDIVASATGKVIPSGRTKVVQPFETGVVRAIHVRDGQAVKSGDVLIELDPTMNDAERDHLRSDLVAAQLDVARLSAALSEGPDPVANFGPPEGASPALVAMQRRFLISQVAENRAKLAALDRQRAQKEAERATTAATIAKLDATIPLLAENVDRRPPAAPYPASGRICWCRRAGSTKPRRRSPPSLRRGRRPRPSSGEPCRASWRRRPRRRPASPWMSSRPRSGPSTRRWSRRSTGSCSSSPFTPSTAGGRRPRRWPSGSRATAG